jgi:hypothetical protein
MKDLIKQILMEEISNPERISKKYLSQLNLEPWEDIRYNLQYLVVPKSNQIIFLLVKNDFECSILEHFYYMLKMFFKYDEQEMTYFVYDYLKDNGLDLPFNKEDFWLSSSSNEGNASKEDGDRPIKRNNLNEQRKPNLKNKFTKNWLKRFKDLKKYKSEDGRFIYLAFESGQIVVSLDTQINETGINKELIFDPIENVLGEKEARRKIIGWLLDNYHLSGMGYVVSRSSDRLGTISSGDTLIESKKINESTEKTKLERFFISRWDEQKKMGEQPNIANLDLMGLKSKRNEIIGYFMDYMGFGEINSRTEAVKKYLLGNTFTEKQITNMDNFDDGKIKIRFNKVEFSENDNQVKNNIDLDVEFTVLSGSFYNSEEGETYSFSSDYNPFEDFVTYFEFKEEIEQVVESFIFSTLEDFGYKINNDFDYISVKW